MTVIVGLVESGKVWMGGDSAGVAGMDISVRADKKVFLNGSYLMGFTHSFRMGQVLQYAFSPPSPPDDDEKLFKFMVTDFVDELRRTFKNKGFASSEDGGRESGGTFLVGVKGQLFSVQGDYQVAQTLDKFDAVGCGEPYAIASLYTTQGLVFDPAQRVATALACADRYSGGVCAPYTILSI